MVKLIRTYQRPLLFVITILLIIAFAWLYNGTRLDKITNDAVVRIYGKNLSQADIQRAARRCQMAGERGLDLKTLSRGLGGGADANQDLENFVTNSFVLEHEVKALGITATDEEVKNAIMQLSVFQTNSVFDPTKYQYILENLLSPNGFTSTDLEDMVRDDLRLKKLIDLVGTSVDVSPAEFHALYVQEYQKMDVSVIRFNLADFAAAVQPTADEVKKYYTDHQKTLTTEEKRVVSYVRFDLTDAEKKLKGKELLDARQKLSDRAGDFDQAMLDPKADFNEVAAKQGLKVETTQEFTETQPAPALASTPEATAEAFRITQKDPVSNAVPVGGGFYILHLDKLIPSRPLTEQEATPKVVEQIKNERGHDTLVSKANEVRAKLAMMLKPGKSFADVAKQLGQKVDSFPPFSIAEPAKDAPNANEILEKSVGMVDGDVSELLPTADGGLIIHLDKREPIDEAKLAKDQQTQVSALRFRKRFIAFREWLQMRKKAANIQSLETRPRNRQG